MNVGEDPYLARMSVLAPPKSKERTPSCSSQVRRSILSDIDNRADKGDMSWTKIPLRNVTRGSELWWSLRCPHLRRRSTRWTDWTCAEPLPRLSGGVRAGYPEHKPLTGSTAASSPSRTRHLRKCTVSGTDRLRRLQIIGPAMSNVDGCRLSFLN